MPVEPCGLALGIVGLAGLFTTCVECFDYVEAGQTCGRDYEILLTKLEVQKTRFLIWGENVDITEQRDNARGSTISNPRISSTIERILGAIQAIFTDSETLLSRYGLQPLPPSFNQHRAITGLSSNLTDRCRDSYAKFLNKAGRFQRRTTATAKIRWAICDRSKFTLMIKDLRDLIDGLMDVTPSAQSEERRILREQIDSISDIPSLLLVQDACEGDYVDCSGTASIRIGSVHGSREEIYDAVPFMILQDAQEPYSSTEEVWYRIKRKALQEEIDSLSASIAMLEAVPCSMQYRAQSISISHDISRLEKDVNSWAAGIVTTSRAPLDMLCHAIATDTGIECQTSDILPMHAQGLLRNAMVEAISSGIINTFSITNQPGVDAELTRIYRTISSRSSLAASAWLRCTMSAVTGKRNTRRRDVLKERLPSLTKFIPSVDYSTILESALSFSHQLCDLSASSNIQYRSFTPALESGLNLQTLDLAKRCSRLERDKGCKVGATICMGLERVSKNLGEMECTTIVKRARVICDCTLRHRAIGLPIKEGEHRRDILPAYDSLTSTLPPQTAGSDVRLSHPDVAYPPSRGEGPSQPPNYDFKLLPPSPCFPTASPDSQKLLTPPPSELFSSSPSSRMTTLSYINSPSVIVMVQDGSLSSIPSPTIDAGPSRRPPAQIPSPILRSSPQTSGIYNNSSLILPLPLRQSALHSYGPASRTPPGSGPDTGSNELAVAMEEMNGRMARIMTEVSALQAQMQTLQVSWSFLNVAASPRLGLDAAAASAIEGLPTFLQS